MSVNEVIANALNDLADGLPNTLKKVIEDQNFVTRVQDENQDTYILVDLTKKMVYHEELFAVYSMNLWKHFNSIEKYYDC